MEQEMLEKLGYKVTPKTSSKEALDLFRQAPDDYDLIITDMTMPEITGDKLSQALLEIRPDVPIVLHTGYSETFSENQALSQGIRAYLVKPVRMNQIAATIRTILDQEPKVLPDQYLGAPSNFDDLGEGLTPGVIAQ
jgi:CheY-like chemotaxis protein